MGTIDFSRFDFAPVIELPPGTPVFDFTNGYDPNHNLSRGGYGIGRYDERRPGMYTSALFGSNRVVHMGIDLGAPIGTPVHAFYDGTVHLFGYNGAEGDYGWTLVTCHLLDGVALYALYGHLSARSIAGKTHGQPIRRGDVLGWVGDRDENGGWNPHLHLQLSYQRPERPDMPGVVSDEEREEARRLYPDPRLVLGPIY